MVYIHHDRDISAYVMQHPCPLKNVIENSEITNC